MDPLRYHRYNYYNKELKNYYAEINTNFVNYNYRRYATNNYLDTQ